MIAWNTQKRHIISQMTETECASIARRTTFNLRNRSPEVRRYLDNAATHRQKFAKLLFTQELYKSDQLTELGVDQYKRMARIADAQKKHQKDTVDFFQNESGYRVCCLASIADGELDEDTDNLLRDMEILSAQQGVFDQAVLLDDLLAILIKRASKYPDYDAQAQKKKYETVLVDNTAKIRNTLESCTWHASDESVATYLENLHAMQPQLNDSTHAAMLSFSLNRDCFKKLNQDIFEKLAELTMPLVRDNPDFMLQAA